MTSLVPRFPWAEKAGTLGSMARRHGPELGPKRPAGQLGAAPCCGGRQLQVFQPGSHPPTLQVPWTRGGRGALEFICFFPKASRRVLPCGALGQVT